VTVDDIKNFEKSYRESDEEKADLKQAYLDGEGDMDFILDTGGITFHFWIGFFFFENYHPVGFDPMTLMLKSRQAETVPLDHAAREWLTF
jgi:hypothetical protein